MYIFFPRRYLAYEFNHKMNMDITEHDVQYSMNMISPNKKIHMTVVYIYCVNMQKKITRNASITIEEKDSPKIRKRIRMEIKSLKLKN